MPNYYLLVLYKHIIQVENKHLGLKVGGHKHTIAPPSQKSGGGGTCPPCPPPPPPPPPRFLRQCLLIALPNPNQKMIKQINTLFLFCIWENKTEKCKRNLITQNYTRGGIKMININNFITALKCTWIRRFFL